MTRDEATRMVQRLYLGHGVRSAGLNANGFGGAMIGLGQVYFEHRADGILLCSALIYTFHDEPKPGIVEGFQDEERSGRSETGGGTVQYEPQNRGLYLARAYSMPVPDRTFRRDIDHLLRASLVWGREVLERVANRVFGHDEAMRDER